MAGLDTAGQVLRNIFVVAKAIYRQCEQAKTNKKLCKRLTQRIELLTKPLKKLDREPDKTREMEEILAVFLSNLKLAEGWVETYSTRSWWRKLSLALSIYKKIGHINDQLRDTAEALLILLKVDERGKFLQIFKQPLWKDIKEDIDNLSQLIERDMKLVGDKVDSVVTKVDEVGEKIDGHLQQVIAALRAQNEPQWHIREIPTTELKYEDLMITNDRYRMYRGMYENNPVLIKVMMGELETDNEVVKQTFWKECKTMKKYESPNILRVFGICMDNTCEGPRYSLVTEFCEKGTLRDLLRTEKDLKWERKLTMALDATRALYCIHRAEKKVLYHLDMKMAHESEKKPLLHGSLSSRKYLVKDYCLKLSGFEFSKTESSMRRSPDKKPEKELEVAYCAPEMLTNADYDQRSEIFSLGVVIYEIVTGSLPLQGISLSDGDVYLKLCDEVSANLLTSCPPVLRAIIRDCLQRDPQKRPTAGEIANRLVAELQPPAMETTV